MGALISVYLAIAGGLFALVASAAVRFGLPSVDTPGRRRFTPAGNAAAFLVVVLGAALIWPLVLMVEVFGREH